MPSISTTPRPSHGADPPRHRGTEQPSHGFRYVVLLLITIAAAIPSFVIASHEHSPAGMLLGVLTWYLILAGAMQTRLYSWLNRTRSRRIALRTTYAIRAIACGIPPVWIVLDAGPGILSIGLIESMGIPAWSDAGTYLVTLVQGGLLNASALLVAFPAILGIVSIFSVFWHRHRVGVCSMCGYDLRGRAPGETCSECGWVIAWEE